MSSMLNESRMGCRLSCAALLCLALTAGCTTEKKADAAQPRDRREGSVAPRASVVENPAQPYRPIAVTGAARLTGTIDFDGPIPRDSVVAVPPEATGCGTSVRARLVEHTGTRIGGAVVWLADIRAGKPLPLERRFELSNEECILTPSVQAVVAPGTLIVGSHDVTMHRNRIIDVATGDLEGIAPFNDNGEVVPFDKLLRKPAQLEITCEIHPWSKASILVFDHPYFAMSEKSGAFSIDGVPPGTYRVRAWHPRLGVADGSVTITANQPATISLKLSAELPLAPAVPSAPPGDS